MAFLERLADLQRTVRSGLRVADEVAARWNAVTWRCDWRWQQLGAAVLSAARRDLQNVTVPCGLWHGDFAPWNTRVRDGQLSAFDWESCEADMPLGWDAFHFSVQVASRLKKGWRTKFDLAQTPGARGLFLLYLLFTLGRSLDERAESNQDLDYRRRALVSELAVN
jgi:hypothetical protein